MTAAEIFVIMKENINGKSGNKGKFQAPVVKYLLCFNISWVIIVYTLWPYNVGKNATNKKEDEET